jgi:hypothetical protein
VGTLLLDLLFELTRVYSGIMRFTVTVVVIMFELTGALTYILPTMVSVLLWSVSVVLIDIYQIVILVTKAVGDLLGVRGIAEEIIRFNDYPFLDKDEHAPDVPGMIYLADRSLLIHISLASGQCHEDKPSLSDE